MSSVAGWGIKKRGTNNFRKSWHFDEPIIQKAMYPRLRREHLLPFLCMKLGSVEVSDLQGKAKR